jgi:predicted nucleic acid-binding protein
MVLSEGFKSRPDPNVFRWLETSRERDIAFLSVITVGEISRGIARIEKVEGRRPDRYTAWLEATLSDYGRRVLPITIAIARRWGRLTHELHNTNPDLLIAATALEHDLTVVTRNTRHFEPTGAKLLNPYES